MGEKICGIPVIPVNDHTAIVAEIQPSHTFDRQSPAIPPPHTHRHRYHEVLAPNAKLRAAVTALAREASNGAQQQTGREKESADDAVEALWRSPARYLWDMLLACIYEFAPLAFPQCGADPSRYVSFFSTC